MTARRRKPSDQPFNNPFARLQAEDRRQAEDKAPDSVPATDQEEAEASAGQRVFSASSLSGGADSGRTDSIEDLVQDEFGSLDAFEAALLDSVSSRTRLQGDAPEPSHPQEGRKGNVSEPRKEEKGLSSVPFNRPFQDLADRLGETAAQSETTPSAAFGRADHEPSPKSRHAPDGQKLQAGSQVRRDEPRPAEDEEALFLRAMQGVEPLPSSPKDSIVRPVAARPRPVEIDEEADALARLSDLVTGAVSFDISDTTEYVEGIAKGLDRRLLARLRKGFFSVQDHIDLHGMTREEARKALIEKLVGARRRSLRCLLVITGRGLHSEGKEPVLKTAVVEWLTGKKLGRHVLAFCSARPHDGGAGAVYVLLRR